MPERHELAESLSKQRRKTESKKMKNDIKIEKTIWEIIEDCGLAYTRLARGEIGGKRRHLLGLESGCRGVKRDDLKFEKELPSEWVLATKTKPEYAPEFQPTIWIYKKFKYEIKEEKAALVKHGFNIKKK